MKTISNKNPLFDSKKYKQHNDTECCLFDLKGFKVDTFRDECRKGA